MKLVIKILGSKRGVALKEKINESLRCASLKIEVEEFEEYVPIEEEMKEASKYFQKEYLREPLVGEIGCMRLHRIALNQKIEEYDYQLILEDDAILSDKFIESLEEIVESRINGYILLGHSKVKKEQWANYRRQYFIEKVKRLRKITLVKYRSMNMVGTVGYLVDKKTAKKILKIDKIQVADDISMYGKSGVDVWTIYDAVVYEDLVSESTISENRNIQHEKKLKINFRIYIKDLINYIKLRLI